jgi:outer membrane protein OmpA-like peptidoglycan-associated protein
MKKTIFKIGILFFICLSSLCTFAQLDDANKHYLLYEYADAIPKYKKHLVKESNDYNATKSLFNCYRYTNNITEAISTGKQVITLSDAKPDDWYNLVQVLKIAGNISEAKPYADQYLTMAPGDKANSLIESLKTYEVMMANKADLVMENKTAQFDFSTFSLLPFDGKYLVTAEAQSGAKSKWTGRGYTKLFLFSSDFSSRDELSKQLASKGNDGIATTNAAGDVIWYTSIHKKSTGSGNLKTKNLKLIEAINSTNGWTVRDLPFNNKDYNVAHPAISGDQKMLVFASDMPGGKGGMDLYYTIIGADGKWSLPVNIASLNTSETEVFPVFIGNMLYFSSNGHAGLGGLDIFEANRNGTDFGGVKNVGYPINSSYDDFSLYTNDKLKTGYVSTNRYGNAQLDDIAYFYKKGEKSKVEEVPKLVTKDNVGLEVLVQDKYTKTPLPYVAVEVRDKDRNVVAKGLTGPDGKVIIEDLPKGEYTVQGELNGITTTIAKVSEKDFADDLIQKIVTHNDPRFTLSGKVVNSNTGEPVQGVTVYRQNSTTNRTEETLTGTDGGFFFQLEQKSDFTISGEKHGWLTSEVAHETTQGLDRTKELYVKLELDMQQPSGNAVIRLDKIFYDFDKCDIKPVSADELNRLVKLMNDYPDMTVELSSHTDSRGSSAYNKKLSQCRADAAVLYIVSKGIPRTRIVAKGYGENKLVNRCADGIECSDDKHQQNRRTEFTIISCKSCPPAKN